MSTLLTPSFMTSRRGFFSGTGRMTLSATAIALLSGREALATTALQTAETSTGDVDILNAALGAEQEAIAAYQLGAESGLLKQPALDLAVTF